MALVLRKAVLMRNVSFLKCIKGRQLATTANKSNPAPLSKAVLCRSLKSNQRSLCSAYMKIGKSRPLSPVKRRLEPRRSRRMRLSMSCPTLASETRPKIRVSTRHLSPPARAIHAGNGQSASLFATCTPLLRIPKITATSKRSYSKPCPCPCACGCSCLPPPCNTPPRCVQYMTGYYYYPYGTWFCGPYHVSGTCTPIGPCSPGGPCGPCCGVCPPCGPCGPCGPCCGPCGPCTPKCICPAAVCPGSFCPPAMCTQGVPIGMAMPQPIREMPRSGVMPGNQIRSPLSQDEYKHQIPKPGISKSGISRFFPFDNKTTNSPTNTSTGPGTNPKNLPTSTVLASFLCPNGTQGAHADVSIYDPLSLLDRNTTCHPPLAKSFTHTSIQTPQSCTKSKNKRSTKNSCPPLERPRTLLTVEQRNQPRVKPGAFTYASISNYRNPYPRPDIDLEFKCYESQ